MSYGSRDGVQAYTKHMTFDTTNNPSGEQIDTWLTQRSAILDGWLASAGYTIPVTTPEPLLAVLDYYATIGAAADAELTQISAAFSMSEESRRDVGFESRFREAQTWITSGAPAALGATQDATPGPFAGLRVSGGGNEPIFKRSQRVYDLDANQTGRG